MDFYLDTLANEVEVALPAVMPCSLVSVPEHCGIQFVAIYFVKLSQKAIDC